MEVRLVVVVVGCYHLGRRKRTEKFELRGCRRSRSCHCQEPLAVASRVFPDITPYVSGGELKGVQSEFKGAQGELKGVQSELKGAQGEQKLKLRAKESDKSKVRRGRRQKRRGSCERLLGRLVCRSSLFVPEEVFKNTERTEL